MARLTKRQKRAVVKEEQKLKHDIVLTMKLQTVNPKTPNQKEIFDQWHQDKNLMVHGLPGTGKTFLTLYLALKEILKPDRNYDRIILVRSAVPTRNIGFLPGRLEDKIQNYELPYEDICAELFSRPDAYAILKNKKLIDFQTTSFLRGQTFRNSIVIVDETQNMTWHEIMTIATRMDDHGRLVFCGDYRQADFNRRAPDIHRLNEVARRMGSFGHIELGIDDIVRGQFVKQFIIASAELDYIL